MSFTALILYHLSEATKARAIHRLQYKQILHKYNKNYSVSLLSSGSCLRSLESRCLRRFSRNLSSLPCDLSSSNLETSSSCLTSPTKLRIHTEMQIGGRLTFFEVEWGFTLPNKLLFTLPMFSANLLLHVHTTLLLFLGFLGKVRHYK